MILITHIVHHGMELLPTDNVLINQPHQLEHCYASSQRETSKGHLALSRIKMAHVTRNHWRGLATANKSLARTCYHQCITGENLLRFMMDI